MKLIIKPVDFIEAAVAVAVADHIVLRSGVTVVRIETPCPDTPVAGKTDDAVTIGIQILPEAGLVFTIAITIVIALIMQVETLKFRRRERRRLRRRQNACQRK